MPEFQIDLGEAGSEWNQLDKFTQGYVEAAFWTESGESDSPCEGKTFADLDAVTLGQMQEDCKAFNEAADAWLHKAYLHGRMAYDMRQAGIDFWLTRNGHGAGFWDRGLGETGDKLSELARPFGTFDLYAGDDGKIYG